MDDRGRTEFEMLGDARWLELGLQPLEVAPLHVVFDHQLLWIGRMDCDLEVWHRFESPCNR